MLSITAHQAQFLLVISISFMVTFVVFYPKLLTWHIPAISRVTATTSQLKTNKYVKSAALSNEEQEFSDNVVKSLPVSIDFKIPKDNEVLDEAVASSAQPFEANDATVSADLALKTSILSESLVMTTQASPITLAALTDERMTLTPKGNGLLQSAQIVDESDYSTLACKFPLLDPWDKAIETFTKYHPQSFNCIHWQPECLSYVSDGNVLKLNASAITTYLRGLNPVEDKLTCTYATVDRVEGSDDRLVYGQNGSKSIEINDSVLLGRDCVNVRCSLPGRPNPVYNNFHSAFADVENNSFGKETDQQLSVLLFFIDSISQSMLRRNLPRTFDYLTNKMEFNVFKGYTKIADNSFPNIIPILSGKRAFTAQADMPMEIGIGEDLKQIFFDHWPLVWKDFAARGYVTVHNEDAPQWGTFHYYMKGFRQKPTHHYFRPFWLTMKYSPISSNFCFGKTPKIKLQLNIANQMFRKYAGKLKFMYFFHAETSHENDTDIERADSTLRDFFKDLYQENYFNRTAILFLSDHGHRYSAIRSTTVGLLEERMPMFAAWFPQWFRLKYPMLADNLKSNELRLSTPFDVYETLQDILNSNFMGTQRPLGQRGLSQLGAIPASRTCKQAGIPVQYCVCTVTAPVALNDPVTQRVASFLVQTINEVLISANYQNVCAGLQLNLVPRAELLEPNQQVLNAIAENQTEVQLMKRVDSHMKMYRIAVEVSPSAALFEGIVVYNFLVKSMRLQGSVADVSRLNAYGNQSHCIAQELVLRKFCFCNT